VKLAIADPPYLGRAARNYGPRADRTGFGSGSESLHSGSPRTTSVHPDAADWDRLDTHRNLVETLSLNYEGWAIAMAPSNLGAYLAMTVGVRVAVWVRPRSVPTGSRVTPSWEPVIVYIPQGRRRALAGRVMTDVHTAAPPQTFVGAKPASWTRWVLDMLGYDPETDTVDDLFPGSGAVSAAIAQGVLL
jgi:hypothetical protein